MGEDIGRLGGVFRVTDGLQKDFGEARVIDTPLAESSILGTAIGMAMRGYRPVVEIQFDGFVYVAFDQIVSQLAKMHARSAGQVTMPVTVRIPYGGGIGAVEHHSESPEAYFAHTAGLRVRRRRRTRWTPTTSSSRRSRATTRWSSSSRSVATGTRPRSTDGADRSLPMGSARVVREGGDVTLVSVRTDGAHLPGGGRCRRCRTAPSIEVVDLRSLAPLDLDTVDGVGAPHRSLRGGARGVGLPRGVCRGRRGGHRAVLLRPGGSGAAGGWVPHALPAVAPRAATTCPTSTGCSTPSTARWPTEEETMPQRAAVLPAGRRRGAHRGRGAAVAGRGGRHRRRSTSRWSRSRPPRPPSSCRRPTPASWRRCTPIEGDLLPVGAPLVTIALTPGRRTGRRRWTSRRQRRRTTPRSTPRTRGAVRCSSATASRRARPVGAGGVARAESARHAAPGGGSARRAGQAGAPRWPRGGTCGGGEVRRGRAATARGPSRRCDAWPSSSGSTLGPCGPTGPDGTITRDDVEAAAALLAPRRPTAAARGGAGRPTASRCAGSSARWRRR